MTRPELNKIPFIDAFRAMSITSSQVVVTMSPGQWDCLLEAAYSQGAVLLELSENENTVAAYRKKQL